MFTLAENTQLFLLFHHFADFSPTRWELITYYNSGEFTKGDKALTISNSVIWSHATITCLAVCLTIAITAGYQVSSENRRYSDNYLHTGGLLKY